MVFDEKCGMKVAFWDVDTGYSDDEEMLEFREKLAKIVDEEMKWLKIEAGDIIIINNDVAVHARSSFRPTFNPKTDRHIMRCLCADPETSKEHFDEDNWEVSFTTCTQQGCTCLNKEEPEKAKKMRLKPTDRKI